MISSNKESRAARKTSARVAPSGTQAYVAIVEYADIQLQYSGYGFGHVLDSVFDESEFEHLFTSW